MDDNRNKAVEYNYRKYVLLGLVVVVFIIFVSRLFFLQIINNDYKSWAESNAFLNKTIYPSRGMIYDRNRELLVYNQFTYDVMVIFKEVEPFDTLDFCNSLGITKEFFYQRVQQIKDRKKNPGYSFYTPQLFLSQLNAEESGRFQERLFRFPGFFIQNRTVRKYNTVNAAHILGSIGEVNVDDLKEDSYYTIGDYKGNTGVERSYEKFLRGEKGVEILLRDARGRVKGSYEDGKYDIKSKAGKNLELSIDINLQAYGEELMKDKLGSIMMIEPKTGEILALVSSPTYDPSMLIGKERGKNQQLLNSNVYNPLFNRAIMATYPPASTFKLAQGLVFLKEGVITPNTYYTCAGGYPLLGGHPACHGHASPLTLTAAIATSCNAFFCWGLHDMLDDRTRYPSIQEAFEVWKNDIVKMGFGYPLGVDLPGESRGFIPNSGHYDKIYKKRWRSSNIISISIGQGEILATPLQLCNFAALIANDGYFIKPHIVKRVEHLPPDTTYIKKRYIGLDEKYFASIKKGMRLAVTTGTCIAANMSDIYVAGKTGTAQNPHGASHSIFLGFAPYENPKVAIVVVVENAGYGGRYAVPIGRLMIEKYLKNEISETGLFMESQMKQMKILPSVQQRRR